MINALIFCFLALIWGGAYVAIKYVVLVYPPFVASVFRFIFSSLFFLAYFKVTHKKPSLAPGTRKRVVMAGLFAQAIPCALVFWGERSVSAGLAGAINGTVPLWTYFLSLKMVEEQTAHTPRKFLGLLIGILGTIILFLPTLSLQGTRDELWATLAIMGMALSYAIATILNRKLVAEGKNDAFTIIATQQWWSISALVVMMFCFEGMPHWQPSYTEPKAWLSLLYLSIGSTAIAWIVFYRLLRDWGAVRASSVTYLVPIMSLAFDFLFFGRAPTRLEVCGTLAVLAGVILIQLPQRVPKPSLFGSR